MTVARATPIETGTAAPTRDCWAVLRVLCGAIFLEGADVAMMGVALPSIRADLACRPPTSSGS